MQFLPFCQQTGLRPRSDRQPGGQHTGGSGNRAQLLLRRSFIQRDAALGNDTHAGSHSCCMTLCFCISAVCLPIVMKDKILSSMITLVIKSCLSFINLRAVFFNPLLKLDLDHVSLYRT